MYTLLKAIHVSAAVVSISGFVTRGLLVLCNSPLSGARFARIAPHVVDSVFLLSGIGLIAMIGKQVLVQPWLLAKFGAIVLYILFGTVALKRGRTRTTRTVAFVLAVIAFAYVAGTALGKSPASWAVFHRA